MSKKLKPRKVYWVGGYAFKTKKGAKAERRRLLKVFKPSAVPKITIGKEPKWMKMKKRRKRIRRKKRKRLW